MAILLAIALAAPSVDLSVSVVMNMDELADGTLVPSLPPDPDIDSGAPPLLAGGP
jgi:hypothetical protein